MIEIRIPDMIKVGGFDYRISHDPEKNIDLEDMANFGTHSELRRIIELRTDISEQQKSSAFIHECIHAVDSVYLNKSIKSEDLITGLANGLHQIFEELGIRFVR